MVIKFKKTDSRAEMPTRGSREAAGYDLYALPEEYAEMLTDDFVVIAPGGKHCFDTGIAMEIPVGYYGALHGRSGMANRGLRLTTGTSVIDSDYRDSVKVVLYNDSQDYQKVYFGDRIAQIVIQKHEVVNWQESETLAESERGTGGFGSTGA
jgi:dUTP pyrophosphatase